MARKLSITVYVDPDQHAKLKALAAKTRIPMAVWIRRGITFAINEAKSDLVLGGKK
jgi:hypothetical protein